NTDVFVHSDIAWASYQWEFLSSYQGKPYSAHGQTTLILQKEGDNWLIVHNHTSQVCAQAPDPPQQPQSQPAAPNPAAPAPAKPQQYPRFRISGTRPSPRSRPRSAATRQTRS